MALKTETKFEFTDYDLVVAEIVTEKVEKLNSEKIAKNLKNKGFSLVDISEATGLTV